MPLNMFDPDYDTLARLQQPQMMPNAPMGAGGMAGMMYYRDKEDQQDTLAKLSQVSDMKAQMLRGEMDEHNAGAPGRMADIGLKNVMSTGALNNAPTALESQRNESETKASTTRTAKQQALIEEATPFANQWVQAKDKESKDLLREMWKQQGVTIGGKKIDEIPDSHMDKLMSMSYESHVNSSGNVAKRLQAATTGEYSLERERIKAAAALERSNIRAKAMEKIKELDKQKPESRNQYMVSLLKKGDKRTDEEEETLNYLAKIELGKTIAAEENKSPTINIEAVNPKDGVGILKDPKPVEIPKPPGRKPITKDGVNLETKQVILGGEAQPIVEFNGPGDIKQATRFKLKNGTIVDKDGKVVK